MNRLAYCAAFFLSALASPNSLAAQSVLRTVDPAVVAQIQTHLENAEYPEAAALAVRTLDDPSLTASSINWLLELEATAQIALGDVAANETLERLFGRDPGYVWTERDPSPPVIAAIARARARARIEPLVFSESALSSGATDFRFDLSDDDRRVGTVEVNFSCDASGPFAVQAAVLDGDLYRAQLNAIRCPTVYWFARALTPSGRVLGTIHSEETPGHRLIAVDTPPPQDNNDWIIWTLLGITVIGAGAVVTVLVVQESEQVPQGSLGSVTLMRF